MKPIKLHRFVLAASGLLLLFVLAWPVVRPAYRAVFVKTAGLVNVLIPGDAQVRVRAAKEPKGYKDVEFGLGLHSTGKVYTGRGAGSFWRGYIFLAAFGALCLATPIPWRRRLKSAVIGIVLVQALIVVRLVVPMLSGFSLSPKPGGGRLMELGPTTQRIVEGMEVALWMNSTIFVLLVLFLWAALTLRAEDLERIEA